MLNPLYFSSINAYTNCVDFVSRGWTCHGRPSIIKTILSEKIVENPIVTPTNNSFVVAPSAKNRTLGSVTVSAQTPLYFKMSITGTASDSVVVNNASTAVSSDTAVATVAIAGDSVVVTGVAAGTSVVSVFDVDKNLIATIYVTVI